MSEQRSGNQDTIRVRLHVTGRVQGVGFRQSARQTAHDLGIRATAENMDDGSVIIETSGPRHLVDRLIKWARRGPDLAEVDNVTVANIDR